jgi:RNA polymerase sigma-70 factor (ECF subfamily)
VSSRALAGTPRRLDPADLGRHLDRLYRAAWALCGSREDAEDLVQDAFARVLARPRFLRSDDDLGYLLRVLRHSFVSSVRARARRPHDLAPIDGTEIADPATARRPDELAETRQVYAAISTLPPNFRDALVAVDVVGLSYGEAAKGLGVKEATLTTRLYRARARVIAELDPIGKESAPGGVEADGDGINHSTGGCRPAARRDRAR